MTDIEVTEVLITVLETDETTVVVTPQAETIVVAQVASLSESDPMYMADKPTIALKTEVEVVAEGLVDLGDTVSSLSSSLSNKVDKEAGKGLSTNDLTNTLKSNYDAAFTEKHSHANKAALDNVSGVNTGDQDLSGYVTEGELSSGLATKSDVGHNHTGIYEPANANIQSHISNTSNPHGVTKSQVGLGNVDNTSDANKPISTATQTALDDKVTKNILITGATKTKITYDSKGLVTGGSDATTADIADSTDKRYITDVQQTLLGNTSGINSGNETTTTIGALINGATTKTTPVDVDQVGLMDSAASNVLKKLSWASIKATLKTYFDTLYATVTHSHTTGDITDIEEYVEDKIGSKVVAGTNVTVNYNDTTGETTISATGGGGGQVDSVVAGEGVLVDATDAANPVVSVDREYIIAYSIVL